VIERPESVRQTVVTNALAGKGFNRMPLAPMLLTANRAVHKQQGAVDMMTGFLGQFCWVRSSKVIPCGLFSKSHSIKSNRSPEFKESQRLTPGNDRSAFVACGRQDVKDKFTDGF
jgi:hypothetical protein